MRREADEGVLFWGKLQWESMGTIIIGLCPYTILNGVIICCSQIWLNSFSLEDKIVNVVVLSVVILSGNFL